MALSLRLSGIVLLAAAIGCPKPVAAPKAVIGKDATATQAPTQNGIVGDTILLEGDQSADPGNRDMTFTWSFQTLPLGSAATLNDAHSKNPSFVADVGGTGDSGKYVVQLVVANA